MFLIDCSFVHSYVLVALSMYALLPLWQFILEVLGDGAIEKYGRDDLYDVFLATEEWNFVKACK